MEQKLRRDRNMGENLRRLRIKNGFSQEKLCVELQCHHEYSIARSRYAKYEYGDLNILLNYEKRINVPMMTFLRDWIDKF